MRKTLIVVDMQNDFVYGALGTPEAQAIVARTAEKVKRCIDSEDCIVVFTCDTHFSDYMATQEGKCLPVPHCLKDSEGWQIIPELKPYADRAEKVLDKRSFGFENWRDVFDEVGELESIELIGVCTDICVVSNALILKALYPETQLIVDAACCAGVTPEKHQAALEVMKSCQIHVLENE